MAKKCCGGREKRVLTRQNGCGGDGGRVFVVKK